jgi:NAD(P)H-hydrate epimerase
MKLVTVAQMQKIEKDADAGGLTYDQMMENAGQGLADVVYESYMDDIEPEVVGLVGPGNNGGDTLIALTLLAESGWGASAYLVKRKRDDLVKRFTEAGGELITGKDAFAKLAESIEVADVLLDGILGTGIKLPLKKDAAELLE